MPDIRPVSRLNGRHWLALAGALLSSTLLACASTPKHLKYGKLQSSAMGEQMEYSVYVPPGWASTESLPLVVFLHGGGDDPDCFDEAEVGQHLDAEMRAGRAPRAIVVVPQGDLGFWENWKDGSARYRDWVLRDLLPNVQRDYNTLPCPAHCHVAGISMGGHGALRFAFMEPEFFSSVTAISGPIFSTEQIQELSGEFWIKLFIPVERIWGSTEDTARIKSEDLFIQWRKQEDLKGLRLLLAWGDDDREGIMESNRKLSAHLKANGVQHDHLEFKGGHKWTAWRPILDDVLRFQIWGRR